MRKKKTAMEKMGDICDDGATHRWTGPWRLRRQGNSCMWKRSAYCSVIENFVHHGPAVNARKPR